MKTKLLNMRYLTVTSLEPLGLVLPYAFTVVLFPNGGQEEFWKECFESSRITFHQ